MKELKFIGETILITIFTFILANIFFILMAAILYYLINLYSVYKWSKEYVILMSLGFSISIGLISGISYFYGFYDNGDYDFDFFKKTALDIFRTYIFIVFIQFIIIMIYGSIMNLLDGDFGLGAYIKKMIRAILIYGIYYMLGIIMIKEGLKYYFLGSRIQQTNQTNIE